MPVIPVNWVVDTKRIIGKNEGRRRRRRGPTPKNKLIGQVEKISICHSVFHSMLAYLKKGNYLAHYIYRHTG
jgi:hypothetical protein